MAHRFLDKANGTLRDVDRKMRSKVDSYIGRVLEEKIENIKIQSQPVENQPNTNEPQPKNRYTCEESYQINSIPRGRVLLVNIKTYEQNEKADSEEAERHGSEKDVQNLKELWQNMGHEVEPHDNLTAQQFKHVFREFINKVKEDCCTIIVMSHGMQDYEKSRHNVLIRMHDNKNIESDWIFEQLNSKNCKHLVKKPKLVFIGSCRGEKRDLGVLARDGPLTTDSATDNPESLVDSESSSTTPLDVEVEVVEFNEEDDATMTPTWSDILMIFPCNPGFTSIRHTVEGTWFFQEIVKVFNEYSSVDHLHAMLNRVVMKMAPYQFHQSPFTTSASVRIQTLCYAGLVFRDPDVGLS